MPRKLDLSTACILGFCRKRIPEHRQRRNAITCCTDHQKLYRKLRKLERDRRLCQKCGKPSTPEERAEFRRWRAEQAEKTMSAEKRVLTRMQGIKKHAVVVSARRKNPRKRIFGRRGRRG